MVASSGNGLGRLVRKSAGNGIFGALHGMPMAGDENGGFFIRFLLELGLVGANALGPLHMCANGLGHYVGLVLKCVAQFRIHDPMPQHSILSVFKIIGWPGSGSPGLGWS